MQTVEMWLHRSGYHPPNEPAAIHCRRRYRLLPSKVPNNLPPPDPSLWIVHYSRAPPTDHIPANRIPILPQVQSMLGQRRFLQSQGQLARKDFMLHDRNSWPTINFPPQMAPQGFAQPAGPYAGAVPGRAPFYPQPGQMIPGAAGAAQVKAPRGHRASSATMNSATADFALEDEDVSAGDMMDLLTPREVSKMRYQQHHEWMEEIFASPYAISQITPVSLGLGRKGELESLTSGFFDAPVGPSPNGESKDDTDSAQVAKVEPAKAEEFADRVAKKVSDMTAEIEKMKKCHAQRMERFNRTSLFKDAELRLRDAATNPAETGSEIWRLEGRVEIPTEDGTPPVESVEQGKPKHKVDDIIREVESAYQKQITPEPKISCVQKGGLLEKIEPEHKADSMMGDMVMDTDNLLDQFANNQQPDTTAAPGQSGATQPAQPQGSGMDVEMNLGNGRPTNTAAGETGDWVMVNNEKQNQGSERPPTAGTSGSGAQGLTPGQAGGDTGLDTSNFDFTNMDSAGDALAAYTEQNEGLDLPDLETSAFGDAFHASDHENTHHHHEADDMS